MRAVVYHGPGQKAWEEVPDPEILDDGDAILRVDAATICGTDLHILKGDVPEVREGRVLGHEAVGTVEEVGDGVHTMGLVDTSSTPVLMRLVDTSSTPVLMRLVNSGQIDARRFITHHFGLDEFDEAYDTFARAADTGALKVVLSR
jgi:threonine dehydrogenase-like Zn-dependent dehydrogenase